MNLLQIFGPIVLLYSSLSTYSQGGTQDLIVSHSRMNVVYQGIPNSINIAVPGVECEALKVSVSHGELTGEGCYYTIIPDLKGGPELEFTVRWTKDGEEFLSEYKFRCKTIPDPVPLFGTGSAHDDSLAISVASSVDRPRCVLESFEFDVGCTITSFRIRLFDGDELIFEERSASNKVDDDMRTALRSAAPGVKLVIDELFASIKDGREGVELVPLQFILKR